MNKHILITGGAGFIGSNLAHELVNRGAHVTIVDALIPPYGGNLFNLKPIQKKIKFIKADVSDFNQMEKIVKGKDVVFHLAGQTGRTISMENPRKDLEINALGTLSILEAIKKTKRNIKLIFSSSRGVIGEPEYLPVDENHPPHPKDVYGANKLVSENYCLLYGREYKFGVTCLRFNNVYGPRCQIKSNHYGTVNLFVSYALQKKSIPVYGTGKQTRDYVYITDVVDSLIASMNKKANGEVFFVGSGKEYSILEIVEIIKNHITDATYSIVPYPKKLATIDFPRFVSSYKRINTMLGWTPKIDLAKGIEETIAYYSKNLKYYL